MAMRTKVALAFAWIGSLALVVGLSAATRSQAAIVENPVEPKVFAGEDLGFRVTAVKGDTPTGVWVIRVNGKWVTVGPTALAIR